MTKLEIQKKWCRKIQKGKHDTCKFYKKVSTPFGSCNVCCIEMISESENRELEKELEVHEKCKD